MTGLLLGLALLGILLGAVAQAATGMGFSLVAAPMLVVLLGPREGVAATLVLGALSSVLPLVRDGRHAQPRTVAGMLVPTLLCTPLVAWAVSDLDVRWMALASGVGIVAAVTLLACGLRSPRLGTPTAAAAAGVASAGLSVVGGVGGAAIGIYAANAGWSPRVARANLHWYFLVQNSATAVLLGAHLPSPAQVATLCTGTAVGMVVATRVADPVIRGGVLALSMAGGLGLIGAAW
ncbi:TSUP family transporter [Nocardioides yefusunii]|uniref:Probable membrane transporter protein n=1 Tax=Nocardioides yefusunii TaxID=2500546 RepID=A0ABW1QZN9_9ACTN|nr:TSUP family transporter [Nocardioides yefusunii]